MNPNENSLAPSHKSIAVNEFTHNLHSEELIAFPVLFARQLAKTPNNTALVFEDKIYTYQQLNQLSDAFSQAVLLQQSDNQTQQACIGICIDKSPEAIAAMLGVLKSGAAFVPLDPEYPADRIAYMIDDAQIATIIAQPEHQQRLQESIKDTTLTWLDCYAPLAGCNENAKKQAHTECDIKPNDLAYIMYTSGSTGKPKGVQIEHAALATYCFADIEVYKVVDTDRTLQFSTINFDIAIEEIFPPLLSGGAVVIRPSTRSDSLNELSTIINDYQITAVHIATAYWHEWVDLMLAADDTIPASLRLMVVTGEKVSTLHYQHWRKLCKKTAAEVLWCNAYGPTEATVSASVFIPSDDFSEDNMPIGKPLKRYTAIIVDDDNNDLPIGETGQLLIGGPALARGYLNRPELNAGVFVTLKRADTTERMYKTGDLARWRENGDIEFAGRIDHQIKLGSYRIEPGEIEVAINQYPEALESLVNYDEVDGKKALIAYIAQGKNNINLEQLSDYLKQNLPAYMVPARFILLKIFPKTTNGKIDRKALPDPSNSEVARSSGFVAPRNQLEKALANMWQDVLRLPQTGIHDDFFALGGSSLLAVGVVSRLINELDLELPVRDFFANPTIASQAAHIQRLLNNGLSDKGIDAETAHSDSLALRDRLPIIKPSFFSSTKGKKLYGIHYQPPLIMNNTGSRNHAVLMCHPLGHEYPRSYRNLQQLAIQLSQAGFDVFRFDYFGTGNSEGSSEDITAEQCALDIEAAANYLRQQSGCKTLSLLSVRLGATFALHANVKDIENMIIWDPVMQGADYVEMLETFHDKELKAYNFFSQIRYRSDTDQLFGHAYNLKKRSSLRALAMPVALSVAKQHHLISTSNFLESEKSASELGKHWQHLPNNDEVYWHDQAYAFSAFSSPETFKSVLNILKANDSEQP